MGYWERGRYYTRSRKRAGRVIREYVGGGLVGELAAAQDARERAEREAKAAAWATERACVERTDAPIASLDEICRLLTHAVLLAAGFHQHHRGEWRQRR